MKFIGFLLLLLVPFWNTTLNILTQQAAKLKLPLSETLLSGYFWAAFAIGTCSFLTMFSLYRLTDISASRGLLYMGAISIVGGTLAASFIQKRPLPSGDLVLLAVIAITLIWRIYEAR